jgi:hypothetical protein
MASMSGLRLGPARPLLETWIQRRPATTCTPPVAGDPAGPDQTGPHGLLPPLQRETLAFDRPYEAGLQWTVAGQSYEHDSWLQ